MYAYNMVGKPFRILVSCKRVIDYAVRVRVKSDGSGVERTNIKHSMNPFDEIAVEESLRLRDKLGPSFIKEVVAISCGPKQQQETLRTALALGADRAIHINYENEESLQPIMVSKGIAGLVKKLGDVGIILLGKQAIDDDANQTGQLVAGYLNWPQATFASKVDIEDNYAIVRREVDNGTEIVKMPLPVIITTDLRLNEPRYATLQNIMKAKNKPLDLFSLESLGLGQLEPNLRIEKTSEPPKRPAGVILESLDQLIGKIQHDMHA